MDKEDTAGLQPLIDIAEGIERDGPEFDVPDWPDMKKWADAIRDWVNNTLDAAESSEYVEPLSGLEAARCNLASALDEFLNAGSPPDDVVSCIDVLIQERAGS